MSIKERPGYYVECDEPGCHFETEDLGGYYAFWGDRDAARDEWESSSGQIVISPDGTDLYYCPEHARPVCAECGRCDALVQQNSGWLTHQEGDWWCPAHVDPDQPIVTRKADR